MRPAPEKAVTDQRFFKYLSNIPWSFILILFAVLFWE